MASIRSWVFSALWGAFVVIAFYSLSIAAADLHQGLSFSDYGPLLALSAVLLTASNLIEKKPKIMIIDASQTSVKWQIILVLSGVGAGMIFSIAYAIPLLPAAVIGSMFGFIVAKGSILLLAFP